jgi:DNA-binding CsgD family transcriptional regulator
VDGVGHRPDSGYHRIVRVAVVDENDIFRRGIVACLHRDDQLRVVFEERTGPVLEHADVAVASVTASRGIPAGSPMLICADARGADFCCSRLDHVVAVLPRDELTEDQLVAAVRAAASGLRVQVGSAVPVVPPGGLPERTVEILKLLAIGCGTREISSSVGYSERTVKSVIQEAERRLGARSRAHVVAVAIQQGLI